MIIEDGVDRTVWDEFVKSHPESNFLQSWDFYEFHIKRGKKVVRRLVREGEKIVGAYAGVVETAKRGRYLAIAGGPILDWKNRKLVKAVFDDIRDLGVDDFHSGVDGTRFFSFRKNDRLIEGLCFFFDLIHYFYIANRIRCIIVRSIISN